MKLDVFKGLHNECYAPVYRKTHAYVSTPVFYYVYSLGKWLCRERAISMDAVQDDFGNLLVISQSTTR